MREFLDSERAGSRDAAWSWSRDANVGRFGWGSGWLMRLMWLAATVIRVQASDVSTSPDAQPQPRQSPIMAEVLAAPLVTLSPAFCRVELATGATTTTSLEVVVGEPTQLVSMEADCGCLRPIVPVDRHLPLGRTTLHVNVVGVLSGVKTLTVRTTAGTVTAIIQVVTPGLGDGAAVAAHLRTQATKAGHHLVVLVHDLLGETRNCGCSGGSLGGIDHLAALREVLPGARLVLTGRCEQGAIPVVGPLLVPYGWELAPADIAVTSEPLAALERPGLLALVNTSPLSVANQWVVQPVLERGALAVVLEITPQGLVVAQYLLPIDQSLPAVAAVAVAAAAARAHATEPAARIDRITNPATSCATCHPSAHPTPAGHAHARTFDSLLPADQGTACVTCHSTLLPRTTPGITVRAPHVSCPACHNGTEAHAAAPTTRTTRLTVSRQLAWPLSDN